MGFNFKNITNNEEDELIKQGLFWYTTYPHDFDLSNLPEKYKECFFGKIYSSIYIPKIGTCFVNFKYFSDKVFKNNKFSRYYFFANDDKIYYTHNKDLPQPITDRLINILQELTKFFSGKEFKNIIAADFNVLLSDDYGIGMLTKDHYAYRYNKNEKRTETIIISAPILFFTGYINYLK